MKQEITLSSLAPVPGSKHRRKRLGFGEGSGSGKTCGKGGKGQTARSGCHLKPGFEGGQMPLHRRLPKRGFVSRKHVTKENIYAVVSLAKILELGPEITLATLCEKGLVKKSEQVKIVGGVELSTKLVLEVHAVTASVKEAVEKAGGEVRLVR